MNEFQRSFEDSIDVKRKLINSEELLKLKQMGEIVVNAIKKGHKVFFCGNGGSAADAQHMAAEMLIRLKAENNRKPLPAIALSLDASSMTACCNDYSFEHFYSRMIAALASEGDVVLGISTSGQSANICLALSEAKKIKAIPLAFLGKSGGDAISLCDVAFLVPSNNTARIQESHITAGHAMIEFIEDQLMSDGFFN